MRIRTTILRIGFAIALAFAFGSALSFAPHHEAVAGCDSCR